MIRNISVDTSTFKAYFPTKYLKGVFACLYFNKSETKAYIESNGGMFFEIPVAKALEFKQMDTDNMDSSF